MSALLNQAKWNVFLASMDGGSAMVRLDPQMANVVVPEKFRADDHLVLRFAHGLIPPVEIIECNAGAILATLSFDGRPFCVTIPWTAVSQIWDETREIAIQTPLETKVEIEPAAEQPKLRLV